MASWTDKAPFAYSPYIQQLPVEAMTNVGMELQRRYDAGVQKIQSEIDRVAGLDIVRDVDRTYLQSKLSSLGNKLKILAAGDFSNYQLTNSVAGMASNIGKDRNIQNAVSSTAMYRKGVADMEDARKRGKSSPNREFDFNNEASNWLNSGSVGESFNGRFREVVDVNKKILEALTKVSADIKQEDIAYGINADGTINTNAILDAMHRRGIEEVSEAKIRTAINATLDGNDYDELASRGRYFYKDYSVDQIKQQVDQDYVKTKTKYVDILSKLKDEYKVETNANKQQELRGYIDYYESLLGKDGANGKFDQNYKNTVEGIYRNPDNAKANLYTQNWLEQMSNAFSYRKVKDEILPNPVKENYWKRKAFELDQLKESHLQQYREKQIQLDEGKLALEYMKEGISYGKAMPGLGGGEELLKGYQRTGDVSTMKLESLSTYTKNLGEQNAQLDAMFSSLKGNLSADPKNKISDDALRQTIVQYKAGTYKPATLSLRKQLDDYIQKQSNLQNLQEDYETRLNTIIDSLPEKTALVEQTRKLPSLVISTPSGNVSFSSQEIFNFLGKVSVGKSIIGTASPASLTSPAFSVPKEVGGIKPVSPIVPSDQLTERENYLLQYFNQHPLPSGYLDVKEKSDNMRRIADKKLAEEMADVTGKFAEVSSGIEFKNETEKKNAISKLYDIVATNVNLKTAKKGYEPSEALSILNGKIDDVKLRHFVSGNQHYIGINESQKVPVTSDFVASFPGLGENKMWKGLDLFSTINSFSGSTSPYCFDDDKSYDRAYYNSGLFGTTINGVRSVNLPVSADLKSYDGGNTFNPVFHFKQTDGSSINIVHPYPVNPYTFQSELRGMTDEQLLAIFNSANQ